LDIVAHLDRFGIHTIIFAVVPIYHDQPLDPKKERIAERAGPLRLENVSERTSESETAVDVDEWLRKS
jgi:hypothetical protein